MTADSFFLPSDSDWFVPTEHTRGPWHADYCHAGPPTGLLARAVETLLPVKRLVRLTVNLTRPVPHAGFRVRAHITRDGRTVSLTQAQILDADDRVIATAHALHVQPQESQSYATHYESIGSPTDAVAGDFPITDTLHGLPAFNGDGVSVRYPPGESGTPGPTTAWLRTVPLFADEEPSPFQRICPLADCGNAFGRNAEATVTTFANADLTILLHRDPVGDWLGTHSVGFWEPDGSGMGDAALFDASGRVGRALQTLILAPA